jgi:acetylornithine deacetylase/succinyl-diaminopimelate desuccinylase-like protein
MLSDVQALAGGIGPRGTGTAGEAAAADFVAERLSRLGLPVEWQTFRAVASQNAFPMAINLVALLAVVLYSLGGTLARWTAAGLALSTAPLLWQTIRTANSPLRPLLPQVTSRNVVARTEPQGELCQRAVILAHLDTNRCRVVWQSSTVRYLEPLAYLTLAVLASLGLLYRAGALLGGPGWVWWVALLPAGYVAGSMVSLWKDDRTPYSCGAHDNAASVAVALEIGSRLAAHPLQGTQVWLAYTGAEETDHAGLYALLREHDSLLHEAAFIGLEGVGSGEIVTLTRQGVCAHYRPDPGLLAGARRAHRADDDGGRSGHAAAARLPGHLHRRARPGHGDAAALASRRRHGGHGLGPGAGAGGGFRDGAAGGTG